MHLLIVAKRPVAGLAKTRLQPRFGPEGSAELAAAALADTFEAARCCRAARVVVSFEGDPTGVVPDGFTVFAQRQGSFAERLAGAWEDAAGPGLQIGMDTPQLTAADLDAALDQLADPSNDAVLGPALDGGWWAIGLPGPIPGLFTDIPMSRSDTGELQLARMRALGLSTSLLGLQRDVDEPDDVIAVADACPDIRFARTAARLLASTGTATS